MFENGEQTKVRRDIKDRILMKQEKSYSRIFSVITPQGRNGLKNWGKIGGLFLAFVFLATLGGCKRDLPELGPMKYAPPASGKMWKPTPDALPEALPAEKLPGIPPELQASAKQLALVQLVDVALRINPSTQQAWGQARVAAADWAVARGEYYPTVSGDVAGYGGNTGGGDLSGVMGQVGLSLNYLLLDFGGREARVASARQALIAANWNHNQAIQDVLRNVPQAYYTYIGNKALVRAAEINLKEAKTSLHATEQRRRAGVSTIADVLQAKANMEEVLFTLVSARGSVEIGRGRLATAVGWPANMAFDVAGEPEPLPLDRIDRNIKNLIQLAQHDRPELTAVRAAVSQKEAGLRLAEADLWPKLTATGSVGWSGIDAKSSDWGDLDGSGTSYFGGLQLQIPLFEGFALRNRVQKAKADLEAARAALKVKEESVISDVWDAYYNFRTAGQQLETSESLLESATQSYEVSLARYKAGAADIVELLNAQSLLAKSRAQQVRARTDLYTSYAELLHAIGAELPTNTFGGSPESTGERRATQNEKK